jgi:hypothetical protein
MLHLDDPDHKRIRGLVSQAFNQRAVDTFRPRIRAITDELLDALSSRDSFDVIAEYAVPLPIIVIAEMLGVEARDLAQFKRWSDARSQIFNMVRTPEQSAEFHHWRTGRDCVARPAAVLRCDAGNGCGNRPGDRTAFGRGCPDPDRDRPSSDRSVPSEAVASRFRSSLFGPGGLAQPRRRRRPGQAEMVAQRLALVVAAQEAAVLEFRHD